MGKQWENCKGAEQLFLNLSAEMLLSVRAGVLLCLAHFRCYSEAHEVMLRRAPQRPIARSLRLNSLIPARPYTASDERAGQAWPLQGNPPNQCGKGQNDGDGSGELPVVCKLAAVPIGPIQPRLGLAKVPFLVNIKCRRPPVVQKPREVDDTFFLAGSPLAATKKITRRDRRPNEQESFHKIAACEGFGLYL